MVYTLMCVETHQQNYGEYSFIHTEPKFAKFCGLPQTLLEESCANIEGKQTKYM